MSIEKIINRARKDILGIKPYKSARSTKHKKNNPILLNANENPYNNIEDDQFEANRYPEPQPKEILSIMSEMYNVDVSNIIISRGSDEAIDLIIRSFCEYKKDAIIICPPTFSMYEIYAKTQGINIISVPLMECDNYQINIDELIKLSSDDRVKAIFIPNPSAPLGHMIKQDDLLRVIDAFKDKAIVAIDEAYIELSDAKSFTKYLDKYPNLVILRTLSKAYGLAGLRIGAAIAHESIINILKSIIPPYPLSVPAIDIAIKHLKNKKLISNNIAKIRAEKIRVQEELEKMSFINKIMPSETNFIFFTSDKFSKIISDTAKENIIIRSFDNQIKSSIRISIGSKEENDKLLNILKEI